jgi:hypothetical protein
MAGKMKNLASTADRLAKAWHGKPPGSWDDLRARIDLATGGDLDCQPLDILTDMVEQRFSSAIRRACPNAPMHGGCHYPECPADCAGRSLQ